MQETLVQFLGWEDPLEKGYATHSSILGLSLVAQMVKNSPAMWETWVRSLGCEDPLEEGMVIQSSILSWRFHTNLGAWWTTVHSVARNRT